MSFYNNGKLQPEFSKKKKSFNISVCRIQNKEIFLHVTDIIELLVLFVSPHLAFKIHFVG